MSYGWAERSTTVTYGVVLILNPKSTSSVPDAGVWVKTAFGFGEYPPGFDKSVPDKQHDFDAFGF